MAVITLVKQNTEQLGAVAPKLSLYIVTATQRKIIQESVKRLLYVTGISDVYQNKTNVADYI